jgi:hypothetical protein
MAILIHTASSTRCYMSAVLTAGDCRLVVYHAYAGLKTTDSHAQAVCKQQRRIKCIILHSHIASTPAHQRRSMLSQHAAETTCGSYRIRIKPRTSATS